MLKLCALGYTYCLHPLISTLMTRLSLRSLSALAGCVQRQGTWLAAFKSRFLECVWMPYGTQHLGRGRSKTHFPLCVRDDITDGPAVLTLQALDWSCCSKLGRYDTELAVNVIKISNSQLPESPPTGTQLGKSPCSAPGLRFLQGLPTCAYMKHSSF